MAITCALGRPDAAAERRPPRRRPRGRATCRVGRACAQPSRVGALAATGVTSVEVFARPTSRCFRPADEIVEPGTRSARTDLRLNRFTLDAIVTRHGGGRRDRHRGRPSTPSARLDRRWSRTHRLFRRQLGGRSRSDAGRDRARGERVVSWHRGRARKPTSSRDSTVRRSSACPATRVVPVQRVHALVPSFGRWHACRLAAAHDRGAARRRCLRRADAISSIQCGSPMAAPSPRSKRPATSRAWRTPTASSRFPRPGRGTGGIAPCARYFVYRVAAVRGSEERTDAATLPAALRTSDP